MGHLGKTLLLTILSISAIALTGFLYKWQISILLPIIIISVIAIIIGGMFCRESLGLGNTIFIVVIILIYMLPFTIIWLYWPIALILLGAIAGLPIKNCKCSF